MFAEKVVKPESEVTPCSDAGRFLYMRPVFAKSLAKPGFSYANVFLFLMRKGLDFPIRRYNFLDAETP